MTPPASPPHSPPALGRDIASTAELLSSLTTHLSTRIVGQTEMLRGLLIGLLTGGHVLLEGVPGLAKTLTVSTLAQSIHATFKRIQFTPDLLPADVVGTLIYNPRDATFTPRPGPIFANIVLADEINRAPAKVQSALLEAMQERQVTIGDETHRLPDPFLVLATQNPIEQEGTYPLPEAQVDRFMLKLTVSYPSRSEERRILDLMASTEPQAPLPPILHADDVIRARHLTNSVFIDDKVRDYIVSLVHATRVPADFGLDVARLIEYGASPRATLALTLAARASAMLDARDYVTPHDVKSVAPGVLRHRVVVTYEAEAENLNSDNVVSTILDAVPVP